MDRILVSGVGGGVGQSVIKALQGTSYQVVGMDSEELAAGLHAVPIAYKGLYASNPKFVDRVIQVCRAENCALMFPGHDVELPPLAENANRLRELGIIPVVSSKEVIAICDDKLETCRFLRENGFEAPRTIPYRDCADPELPVVLKPQRGGARSRNTYVARTRAELETYRRLIDPDNCVVQEYIEGDEYTCGSISLSGRCAGVIVMRRILRDGDTYKAFIERNDAIESTVRRAIDILKPFGACNIQLRFRDGRPYIFEFNARCSGTTAARAIAGFNEPKMIADYLLHRVEPSFTIHEVTILRYWKELVAPNERIKNLAAAGHLDGNGAML